MVEGEVRFNLKDEYEEYKKEEDFVISLHRKLENLEGEVAGMKVEKLDGLRIAISGSERLPKLLSSLRMRI